MHGVRVYKLETRSKPFIELQTITGKIGQQTKRRLKRQAEKYLNTHTGARCESHLFVVTTLKV